MLGLLSGYWLTQALYVVAELEIADRLASGIESGHGWGISVRMRHRESGVAASPRDARVVRQYDSS